jgi:hypothetical protein
MGWREEPGHEADDAPPGSRLGLPPDVHHAGVPYDGAMSGASDAPRDERAAGFARDGEWDTTLPSAELAAVLESVSGAGWQCPGATDVEMVGIARRWAAIESWAGAAKLGVIRALIRDEDKPRTADGPNPWSESLTHELSLALAASAGSADRTAWLAWELGARLPGIDGLLTAGLLGSGKARAIAEAFQHLSDADAASAEALILGQLPGKTHMQVVRLAATAASRVDPDGDERRRKTAEKEAARVQLWREQSGTVALAGFGLPTDEALAAHANVCARAEQYKESGAFPGAQMDQLRAMGYLDLLNSVTAEDRITRAQARASTPDDDGTDDSGHEDGGGPGGGDPRGNGPDAGRPAGPPRTDLVVPLVTLLGMGNRPGEAHGLGPLDPALCRDLAATAANSQATRLCVTVTGPDGIAIGHGCARILRRASQPPPSRTGTVPTTALPARLNLTIPLTDLRGSTGPASRGSPWAFTRQAGDTGPPGGYGTWTLTVPDGREFTVRLEQVPTFTCDHAHESHAYQPNDTLRHLVQVRDGDCTFPPCTRHARESDFEHAVAYDKGGRTCACNAGARSRKCHRIKQSPGWAVTQPKPGFHLWTTPTGRSYLQEPKRYPA